MVLQQKNKEKRKWGEKEKIGGKGENGKASDVDPSNLLWIRIQIGGILLIYF